MRVECQDIWSHTQFEQYFVSKNSGSISEDHRLKLGIGSLITFIFKKCTRQEEKSAYRMKSVVSISV